MIALIDYGMGNLRSVAKAFAAIGAAVTSTSSPARLAQAKALILPGVGHFGDGMRELNRRGLADPIRQAIADGIPLLGICLGMQLLLESSDEAPGESGLGIIPGRVLRLPAGALKIPHMGWNQLRFHHACPLASGLTDGTWCYFVHSYYAVPDDPALVQATTDYGLSFPAIIGRGRLCATQFHPEKSQAAGLQMLRNFLVLAGIGQRTSC